MEAEAVEVAAVEVPRALPQQVAVVMMQLLPLVRRQRTAPSWSEGESSQQTPAMIPLCRRGMHTDHVCPRCRYRNGVWLASQQRRTTKRQTGKAIWSSYTSLLHFPKWLRRGGGGGGGSGGKSGDAAGGAWW